MRNLSGSEVSSLPDARVADLVNAVCHLDSTVGSVAAALHSGRALEVPPREYAEVRAALIQLLGCLDVGHGVAGGVRCGR